MLFTYFTKGIKKSYDARANKWITVDGREEDSLDDENVFNALAASHEGNLKNRVYFWCMTRYERPLPIA